MKSKNLFAASLMLFALGTYAFIPFYNNPGCGSIEGVKYCVGFGRSIWIETGLPAYNSIKVIRVPSQLKGHNTDQWCNLLEIKDGEISPERTEQGIWIRKDIWGREFDRHPGTNTYPAYEIHPKVYIQMAEFDWMDGKTFKLAFYDKFTGSLLKTIDITAYSYNNNPETSKTKWFFVFLLCYLFAVMAWAMATELSNQRKAASKQTSKELALKELDAEDTE